MQELTYELKRYQWDILCVAEVRRTRFGEATTDDRQKIWYCGENSKHQNGVALIVRKDVVDSIISCTPISSRLIFIRISVRPQNIAVIQVYQTMKMRRSNSYMSSLIASKQRPPRRIVL